MTFILKRNIFFAIKTDMAPEIVQRQEYDGKADFFMHELNRKHGLAFP